MKVKLKMITLSLTFIAFGACSGSDNDPSTPAPPTGSDDDDPIVSIPDPSAATLLFPEDNTECNEGELKGESESSVTFQWNASQNTDSYTVSMTNLKDNTSFDTDTSSNEISIDLKRGTPYEWFVTSRANGTNASAQSETWRFYNQGPGVENHAPFPAEALNPARGSTISSSTSKVTLQWESIDIDQDIVEYEVFMGLENATLASQGVVTTNSLEVAVEGSNIYRWQIATTDLQGNSSNSEIFRFKVE